MVSTKETLRKERESVRFNGRELEKRGDGGLGFFERERIIDD